MGGVRFERRIAGRRCTLRFLFVSHLLYGRLVTQTGFFLPGQKLFWQQNLGLASHVERCIRCSQHGANSHTVLCLLSVLDWLSERRRLLILGIISHAWFCSCFRGIGVILQSYFWLFAFLHFCNFVILWLDEHEEFPAPDYDVLVLHHRLSWGLSGHLGDWLFLWSDGPLCLQRQNTKVGREPYGFAVVVAAWCFFSNKSSLSFLWILG